MDANAHPGPPATRGNTTTGAKLRLALRASAVALVVVALFLLARSYDVTDLAALRQQHIAQCLISLGILCVLFSLFFIPPPRMTPRWVVPTGVTLALLMLALVLSGFVLYAFAFPVEASLAATLMLIASFGILADMLLGVLLFAMHTRERHRRLAHE
ncbi:MAG TPA: hypothetical protein VH591_22495 [Ktedonobacterales bacterium]